MKTKEEQLKIYAAYLPYRLFLKDIDPMNPFSYELAGLVMDDPDEVLVHDNIDGSVISYGTQGLKPILYDLSYLTKEIEHEGEKVIPIDYISTCKKDAQATMRRVENNQSLDVLDYWKIQRLVELHFNIFSLTEDQFINKATLKD